MDPFDPSIPYEWECGTMSGPGHAVVMGATGLVGSALVRRLVDDGWEVTARSETRILFPCDGRRAGRPGW